ncbi:hypothetical protein EV182_003240 [Spiromyces aspiralis]|uniref:Uncharacterized protein n=1 Tax=Spiromyces aspiralis TaxID=68401 RepID=A0ACC1HGF8_9FUNG|nr:hypothetical protein EV182_003240 [Spiromyces aspiralis]
MVAFHLLVVPATKKLGGCPIDSNAEAAGLTKVQAVWVDGDITLDKVRPEFHRCRVSWEDGRFVARSTGGQRSSRIASMSYANGLVYFQQATETVISIPSGSTVNVYLIGPL